MVKVIQEISNEISKSEKNDEENSSDSNNSESNLNTISIKNLLN